MKSRPQGDGQKCPQRPGIVAIDYLKGTGLFLGKFIRFSEVIDSDLLGSWSFSASSVTSPAWIALIRSSTSVCDKTSTNSCTPTQISVPACSHRRQRQRSEVSSRRFGTSNIERASDFWTSGFFLNLHTHYCIVGSNYLVLNLGCELESQQGLLRSDDCIMKAAGIPRSNFARKLLRILLQCINALQCLIQ